MSRTPCFRYDRAGITRLLLRDTYDREDVYLRELIANAIDAGANQVCLTLIVDKDSGGVMGLLCGDNGRGMTRKTLDKYFFNLGRVYENDAGPRYGRFGIGVFTYMKVARRVEVFTGVPRGRRWHLAIDPPADFESMDELATSQFASVKSQFSGTCVLILLRSQQTLSSIQSSLAFFIRGVLPARLNLRLFVVNGSTARLDLPRLASEQPLGDPFPIPWQNVTPEGAARIPPSELVEAGHVLIRDAGRNRVTLCESGMFVEDANEDLLPHTFQHLAVDALVSVHRGRLDLVSSRTKARRSPELDGIRQSLIMPTVDACRDFLASRTWALSVLNSECLRRIAEACRWLPDTELPGFLSSIEDQVQTEVYTRGGRTLLTLRSIGEKARSAGSLACLEGDTWGWRKSVGSIAGYDYDVFVHQRGYVESSLAEGTLVFHCPQLEGVGPVIPLSGLREYFRIRHSMHMQNVTQLPSTHSEALPSRWQRELDLPGGLKLGRIPGMQGVLLDSNLNAVLDKDDPVLRWLDAVLSSGVVIDSGTKKLAQAYILLFAAKTSSAFDVIRNELLNRIRSSASRTLADLAEEVRNGR